MNLKSIDFISWLSKFLFHETILSLLLQGAAFAAPFYSQYVAIESLTAETYRQTASLCSNICQTDLFRHRICWKSGKSPFHTASIDFSVRKRLKMQPKYTLSAPAGFWQGQRFFFIFRKEVFALPNTSVFTFIWISVHAPDEQNVPTPIRLSNLPERIVLPDWVRQKNQSIFWTTATCNPDKNHQNRPFHSPNTALTVPLHRCRKPDSNPKILHCLAPADPAVHRVYWVGQKTLNNADIDTSRSLFSAHYTKTNHCVLRYYCKIF